MSRKVITSTTTGPYSFWGPNYARLLAVKQKYDPDGLFFMHNGVGTEGCSKDGLSKPT
jgi:hypothetical protein